MLVFSTMISRQIQPLERGFLILIMSSYKFLGEIEISSYSHDKSPFSWSNPHEFLPFFQTDWLLFPPSGDVAFFDHLQKRDGGIFIGHIAEHLLRTWWRLMVSWWRLAGCLQKKYETWISQWKKTWAENHHRYGISMDRHDIRIIKAGWQWKKKHVWSSPMAIFPAQLVELWRYTLW